MKYSADKISTVQACDDLLTRAQRKKQTLARKRRNLGESIDTFRKRMDRIEGESAAVRSSLQALTTAYHAMPEGKDRATIWIMIKRLEVRQARLEKQAYTCNAVYLLIKEMKYNALYSQVAAMENYIDTLEVTRAALRTQPVMPIARPVDFSRPPVTQQSLQNPPVSRYIGARARRSGRLARYVTVVGTQAGHTADRLGMS